MKPWREHDSAMGKIQQRRNKSARNDSLMGTAQIIGGAILSFSGSSVQGSLMTSQGVADVDRASRTRARAKALDNIERKQKGGSAALKGKRADAVQIKGFKGSESSDVAPGGSGSDRLEKRTVADKYDHATSAPGKRIMTRAKGERMSGKYFRGLGHVSTTGAGVAFATGNPVGGAALLVGGSASHVKGRNASRAAEDMRLKSRGVDALVNKAKFGNTLGANLSTKDAAAFADASHKFHTVGRSAPPDGTGDWQNVGEGQRGFGNPNNQKAAQEARKAKGLVK